MAGRRNAKRILNGNPEGKRALRRSDVGRRIILKEILEICDGVLWTGFIWFRV